MKKTVLLLLCLSHFGFGQSKIDVQKEFQLAAKQYEGMLASHADITQFPQSSLPDGSPRNMKSDWWCSGFFGGSLWFLYEQTKDNKWKEAAHRWTMAVAKEQYNTNTHDLGFMLYCPFGNGYRLTQNPEYKAIMLNGAKSLATRFDSKIGLIKSWNNLKGGYNYPVIIDNMMNLELLFWAAKQTGNMDFYNLSTTHADNTIKHHYRPDNSSYHVVCYDSAGAILAKKTHQGAADESAWARGQVWGMYGFVTMYRETKDQNYLEQARKIADFVLNHPNLPANKIPYWDMNAPNIPNEERDASAAAIAASGLLELSKYGGQNAQFYFNSAVKILESLSSPIYKAAIGTNNYFILKHSVGNKPAKSEVDVPLIYADYYYLEALLRYDAMTKVQTYQLPIFTDTNRLQKVQAMLPTIDKIYQDYANNKHFPATSYGILLDGKLIHTNSTGYTDITNKATATAQSQFRIASISKSFTTMAILQLRDAGKLNLDDHADKYIPEMKKAKLLTTDSPPITIRHLMTHAAGFPEDNPWGDRQLSDTNAELLKLAQSPSFSNVPGVAYEYSNLGVTLLGYIITKVSGKPYQQYINEQILRPLDMKNTYWEFTKVPAAQLAHGYRWHNDQWKEEPLLHNGAYGAMGGLITSIEDFGKYMAFHQAAWPPKNDIESAPLKRSSVREMHQPWNLIGLNSNFKYPSGRSSVTTSAYGYGLNRLQDAEGRVYVGHSGGLPGFGSNWRMLPEYGLGVVSFANLTYAPMSIVNLQVLDTLIIGANLKPRQLPASAILKQRQTELLALLPNWINAEKSGIFAENFFADYVLADLQKEAKNIFGNIGKILNTSELIPENQLRGSFILEGEKANIKISFTLTPENPALIQEYHIMEVGRK